MSNLQIVSKTTERAVFNQIYAHVRENELFPELQSAYRSANSTETAQLKIVNDILLNMNSQHVSLLVLLDVSTAFDTVYHNILLRCLETSFGAHRRCSQMVRLLLVWPDPTRRREAVKEMPSVVWCATRIVFRSSSFFCLC